MLNKLSFHEFLWQGFPGSSVGKNLPTMQKPVGSIDPWVRKMPWKRKQQPTPVILPGKSQGQRSLTGYSPWGHKEIRCKWARMQAQVNFFPGGSGVKASAWNAGDPGSIPGSGRSPGEGNGNPLLPGESHGGRSLVGYSSWGHKESDTTERLHFTSYNQRF